jgi:hypothetical protein
MTDKEIYGLLTPILNKSDGKESSDDAKRKWVDARIGEIVQLMNGKHGTNPYNKELLKILVERCFSPLSGTQESI